VIVWLTHLCRKCVPVGDLFQFAIIQFTLQLSKRRMLHLVMWNIHVLLNVTLCCWVFPKLKNSLWVFETSSSSYPTTQPNIPQDFSVQQHNFVDLKSRLYRLISVVVCCTVLYTTIVDSIEIFALLECYVG
jgi:hypothetical protein